MFTYKRSVTPDDDDVLRLMVAKSHFGSKHILNNLHYYTSLEVVEGYNIINVKRIWENLVLAAEVIASIKDPKTIAVVGTSRFCFQSVHAFARLTNTTAIFGNNTMRIWTKKTNVLIFANLTSNVSLVERSALLGVPIISFCNLNDDIEFVDTAIPCNNNSCLSMSLLWWMLAREVLRARGEISQSAEWEVNVDLFYNATTDNMESDNYQV